MLLFILSKNPDISLSIKDISSLVPSPRSKVPMFSSERRRRCKVSIYIFFMVLGFNTGSWGQIVMVLASAPWLGYLDHRKGCFQPEFEIVERAISI